MTSDGASEAIHSAFSRLERTVMRGVITGPVMMSPSSVVTTKGPPFWRTHAKFQVDINEKARSLHSQTWTVEGGTKTIHLYDGGIRFPDICPVTLGPVHRYDVAEVAALRHRVNAQVNDTQERANRMGTAAACDRYWYALPFSKEHNVEDRAIHLNANTARANRLEIIFRNKDYAIQFAKSTGLTGGRWIGSRHIVWGIVGFMVLTLVGGSGVGLSLGFFSASATARKPAWQGAIFLLLGLAGLVTGLVLTVKGSRGEQLIQEHGSMHHRDVDADNGKGET